MAPQEKAASRSVQASALPEKLPATLLSQHARLYATSRGRFGYVFQRGISVRRTRHFLLNSILSLGMGGFASLATAGTPTPPSGVIITYGPVGTAVPTLSGSMLIALAVLLMLVAFRLLKDRPQSGTRAIIAVTAIAALVSAAGGVKLVADAQATGPSMDDPDGGSLEFSPPRDSQVYYYPISNSTAIPLQIKAIQYAPDCRNQGPSIATFNGGQPLGDCSVSMIIGPQTTQEFCNLSVSCGTSVPGPAD